MAKFEIEGPCRLTGEISIDGAKNAALKMIAAAVLIPEEVVLTNVPDILDIQTLIKILQENGAVIRRDGHTLYINTASLNHNNPDHKLVEKLRGSIVLIGPYLSRFGSIDVPKPGGCAIGSRPIDIHLDAFRQMGVKDSFFEHVFSLKTNRLKSGRVILAGQSVTATENVLMAAVLTEGKTEISNAACEPEVTDLANFLIAAGAKISGAGTPNIEVIGVDKLHSVNYKIMPDRIEAGTYLALTVVTKSPLKITNCNPEHLTAFLKILNDMGVNVEKGEDFINIKEINELSPIDIETSVYPGLATDLQAPAGLILTQAKGESRLTENIFENRLGYLNELAKMGAKVKIIDSRHAIITGPTKLRGCEIDSLDLRAGVTLILAGLIAEGKTIINQAEIVDRGYENIEKKLHSLGANIRRVV